MKGPLLIVEKGEKPHKQEIATTPQDHQKHPPNKTNTNENQHKIKQNGSRILRDLNTNLYVNFRSMKEIWYSK